jgi:hypothetical protein
MQSIGNIDILDYCCRQSKDKVDECITFKINTVCFKINAQLIKIN